MMPDRTPALRLAALLVLSGLPLAACVAGKDPPRQAVLSVSSKDLPPIPICRNEMLAYVELTRLAKLHGDDWDVFAPAVDAMKQQILDCLDDHSDEYQSVSAKPLK